jgi:hypothetical protein
MRTNKRKNFSRLLPKNKNHQSTPAEKANQIYHYWDVVLDRLIKHHKELTKINEQLTAALKELSDDEEF